ncbi:hypothetical protein NOK12_16520 [Nocardioides sp. OK12]|uniref:hypothetical protein n=1 Tax=Nocardioides sp. OK12 TaxID=2758661 RepID=UPI0021C270A5|nr:hypothetical protein [Nocardioides sp. OK12]GHJ59134.1 hypothetical protein NOK12_16520 [Nocardioides sp. OK12]
MSTRDSRPHVVAIKAALEVALGADRVYDYGKVPGADNNPGTLPHIYVLPAVERRTGALRRAGAYAKSSGWRVSVRAVGRTPDECRWALSRISLALDEARLTIGGDLTTPIQYESGQAPEPDDGKFSALEIYTYVV